MPGHRTGGCRAATLISCRRVSGCYFKKATRHVALLLKHPICHPATAVDFAHTADGGAIERQRWCHCATVAPGNLALFPATDSLYCLQLSSTTPNPLLHSTGIQWRRTHGRKLQTVFISTPENSKSWAELLMVRMAAYFAVSCTGSPTRIAPAGDTSQRFNNPIQVPAAS